MAKRAKSKKFKFKRRKPGHPTVTQLLAMEKRGKTEPFYKIKRDVLSGIEELSTEFRNIRVRFSALRLYWDDKHIVPSQYEMDTWTHVSAFVGSSILKMEDAKRIIYYIDEHKTNPFDALETLGKMSDVLSTITSQFFDMIDRIDELMRTYAEPLREYIISLNKPSGSVGGQVPSCDGLVDPDECATGEDGVQHGEGTEQSQEEETEAV